MITPYIVFRGACREALAAYAAIFGGEARQVHCYGDYVPEGVQTPPPDLADWVMHAEMTIGGTVCWLADEAAEQPVGGGMVRLTVTVATAEEAQRIFDGLAQGGRVTLPPTETFYSAFHAGLVDRFGVGWNLVAEEAPKQG